MLLREPSGLCHSVKGHNRGLSGAIRKRRQRLMILSLSFSSIYCCILLLLLLLTSFYILRFFSFKRRRPHPVIPVYLHPRSPSTLDNATQKQLPGRTKNTRQIRNNDRYNQGNRTGGCIRERERNTLFQHIYDLFLERENVSIISSSLNGLNVELFHFWGGRGAKR